MIKTLNDYCQPKDIYDRYHRFLCTNNMFNVLIQCHSHEDNVMLRLARVLAGVRSSEGSHHSHS